MAAITASMVAELRAKTDAPMMECKKALTEADGDMVKAEELLRVKLGSKASKAVRMPPPTWSRPCPRVATSSSKCRKALPLKALHPEERGSLEPLF